MATFDDPLELFRVAVERMNADDFRGAAQCCDPVSLRAYQRASVARFEQSHHRRPLRVEDYVSGDPDMPREVAEYNLRKQQESVALYDNVSMEFPGFDSADALRDGAALDVFAAFLEGKSLRHLLMNAVAAGHITLRDVDVSAALNAHRWSFAAVGVVQASASIAHILYRYEVTGQEPTADAVADPWVERERERIASLPEDEQALFSELQGNEMPRTATCRRQPGGDWLLIAGYDFMGASGGMAIGRAAPDDEDDDNPLDD